MLPRVARTYSKFTRFKLLWQELYECHAAFFVVMGDYYYRLGFVSVKLHWIDGLLEMIF